MRRLLLVAVLLLACLPTFGQVDVEKKKSLLGVTSPEIVGNRIFVGSDSNPSVSDVAVVTVENGWKFQLLKFRRDGARFNPEKLSDSQYIISGKGRYELDATLLDNDKGIWNEEFSFELGGPDVQPDIKPDVKPDIKPDVQPAPIPLPGFRVLIIEESSERARLPITQQNILFSPELRDFLNSKCVTGPDGRTPEWRILDQDTQFPATCDLAWCQAMKRPRGQVPWIVISDGVQGYEGRLPDDLAGTMELLRRFAK